jgi:hypothetical protein
MGYKESWSGVDVVWCRGGKFDDSGLLVADGERVLV